MAILSIPRLDVLGCSSPLTRDIGPGLSPHTAGTQGKIGPHIALFDMGAAATILHPKILLAEFWLLVEYNNIS